MSWTQCDARNKVGTPTHTEKRTLKHFVTNAHMHKSTHTHTHLINRRNRLVCATTSKVVLSVSEPPSTHTNINCVISSRHRVHFLARVHLCLHFVSILSSCVILHVYICLSVYTSYTHTLSFYRQTGLSCHNQTPPLDLETVGRHGAGEKAHILCSFAVPQRKQMSP